MVSLLYAIHVQGCLSLQHTREANFDASTRNMNLLSLTDRSARDTKVSGRTFVAKHEVKPHVL